MRKGHYLPKSKAKKLQWLHTFYTELDNVASTLDFTPAEVNAIQNDYNAYRYMVDAALLVKTASKGFTAFAQALANGKSSNSPKDFPTVPTLGPPPVAVAPGIFKRNGKIVQRIKAHPNYSDVIGTRLGIIGPEKEIDLDELMPKVKLLGNYPNKIEIGFEKGIADGVIVYCHIELPFDTPHPETEPIFKQVTRITKSPYIDSRPNLSKHPETRHYKFIYFLNDKWIGQESTVLTVVAAVYYDAQGNSIKY